MFDQLELPSELSKYLISVSPLLGISGTMQSNKLFLIDRYISLPDNKIVLFFPSKEVPKEISLNLLRKGEDKILISSLVQQPLDEKYLKEGKKITVPNYVHSVISFEAKFVQKLLELENKTLVEYEVICAAGVAGLDPDFNDEITIAKTIEVMTLSAVDSYIVRRKVSNI